MKQFITILLVLSCLFAIFSVTLNDIDFSISRYIEYVSENFEDLPEPPSLSDFVSYSNFSELDTDEKKTWGFTGKFFRWIGYTFETIWSFITYPFKLIWFLFKNLKVFFKEVF